jgi:hypothetical protein
MILKDFSNKINRACQLGHEEILNDVLTMLLEYASEPGINLSDVKEQLSCMISEIECYMPEPSSPKFIIDFCKILNTNE